MLLILKSEKVSLDEDIEIFLHFGPNKMFAIIYSQFELFTIRKIWTALIYFN